MQKSKIKNQNYKLKLKTIFCLIFFFLFSLPSSTKAAFSFKIDSINPTSVSSRNDEVEVVLSITDLPSESYFRVAWQEDSGQPYFGYVKNEKDEWVQIKSLGSECSDYYHTTNTGTFSLTLKTKIGEEKELNSGTYLLRAHRFTTACSNTPSENSVEVSVNLPEATATPTPTSVQEAEPTPTPTSSESPTPTPTPKPTKKPTSTPTPKPEVLGEESEEETSFLLSELGEESEGEKKEETEEEKKGIGQWLPPIMIGGGAILIGVAAFPFVYPRLKNKLKKEEFDQEAS